MIIKPYINKLKLSKLKRGDIIIDLNGNEHIVNDISFGSKRIYTDRMWWFSIGYFNIMDDR